MLLANDETDCSRHVNRHTLNYNHRKPYIPLPPALPRFALPNEEDADPLDAAATAERPALVVAGRRRILRRRRPLSADSTEEVAAEDILLEAYAEDPPPPLSRQMPVLPPRESMRVDSAIAALVPAPPAQSAAVDALLRASDPAFAPLQPRPPQQGYASQGSIQAVSMQQSHAADYESSSVSPVMLAPTAPPGRPVLRARRNHRAATVRFAIWSVVMLVVGVASAFAIVLGVRNGTYARLRDSARSIAAGTPSRPAQPVAVAVAAAAAAPPPERPAVAPAPAASAVPTLSIDALPKSPIPADMAMVTFPAYAHGHRVFIDGRIVPIADGGPTKLKCGRHMVKIGTARKARVLDLACGRDVIIE